MNYGFKPELVKIEKEAYKFGSALPLEVIQDGGQWDEYLPVYEAQAQNFETAGCTVFGTLNQIETLHKKLFKTEPNYSERFNYILAHVRPPGANPQDVYECIRKNGAVPQVMLPMTKTFDEFIQPDPMEAPYLVEGQKWLNKYEVKHEWIESKDPSKLKLLIRHALNYSPVACSVTAWYQENGEYVDLGQSNNHWCLCYGYTIDEKGVHLKIYDSYDHSKKVLSPDHNVQFAKRITLKLAPPPKNNWLKGIIKDLWITSWNFLKSLVL